MTASKPIHQTRIAVGKAYEEGRAPSTDAEYLTLYWRPSDGPDGDWILEDNAGLHSTSFGVNDIAADYAEARAEDEWERIYAEVRGALDPSDGELCESCGLAASECMRDWGWAMCDDDEPCALFYDDEGLGILQKSVERLVDELTRWTYGEGGQIPETAEELFDDITISAQQIVSGGAGEVEPEDSAAAKVVHGAGATDVRAAAQTLFQDRWPLTF